MKIYVLDSNDNFMPQGYPGEICIAGDCLADGYTNLPEGAENPFQYSNKLGERIYRTSDLAHFSDYETLIFDGRMGDYIKINDNRVECLHSPERPFGLPLAFSELVCGACRFAPLRGNFRHVYIYLFWLFPMITVIWLFPAY